MDTGFMAINVFTSFSQRATATAALATLGLVLSLLPIACAPGNQEMVDAPRASPRKPPESLLWRNKLSADATVLQLQGGREEQSSQQAARGHIGFAFQGKPILIRNHRYPTEGHNVLQLGNNVPLRMPSPLVIRDFTATYVDARLNASRCYPELNHWFRDVFWNGKQLQIVDELTFKLGERKPITFRWHLATLGPVQIDSRRLITMVETTSAIFEFRSPFPIDVSYEEEFGAIVVRVPEGKSNFKLTTLITPTALQTEPEQESGQ